MFIVISETTIEIIKYKCMHGFYMCYGNPAFYQAVRGSNVYVFFKMQGTYFYKMFSFTL